MSSTIQDDEDIKALELEKIGRHFQAWIRCITIIAKNFHIDSFAWQNSFDMSVWFARKVVVYESSSNFRFQTGMT